MGITSRWPPTDTRACSRTVTHVLTWCWWTCRCRGLDGFETIRQLRTVGDVPIIAASGGGEWVHGTNQLEIALHLGAVPIFEKPGRLNDLVTLARDVLSHFGAR